MWLAAGQLKRRKRKKAHPSTSAGTSSYNCPACFEVVDTFPDPGGGLSQEYVEDCSVCCRPNVIHAVWDEEAGGFTVHAEREG